MSLKQAKLAEGARSASIRKTVEIDGVSTAYWFYPARAAKKSKSSLVLIHGYRGNHHGLEAIAGAIQNSDVYIPDIPGFGQSEAFSQNHDIDSYAEWLNGFIQSLKLATKPHLLGHSFGSIVVSAYAAKYAGIATLILENPVASPALKGPKALLTAVARLFFLFAGALPEKTGDSILQSWPMVRGMSIVMTKSRVKELRRWIHTQHDQNFNDYANRSVALQGYTASICNCVGDFAKTINVPVLMMIGDRDDITSVSQQQTLFTNLASSKKKIRQFNGVGHLTHYEIPDQIAATVEDWVKEND